jgi:hypothetical protein
VAEAKETLLQDLFLEEKYNLVIENYAELEVAILETATRAMLSPNIDYQRFQIERSLFNRRLANLLTTAKMYVDQTPQHVHSIFGRNSEEAQEVDDAFSREYDKRFGYRVFEALRNHVQHSGLPVEMAVHRWNLIDRGKEKRLRFKTSITLWTDNLSKDSDFKKPVLREIQEIEQPIELLPLARDYIEGLSHVHTTVREQLSARVTASNERLHETIDLYKVHSENQEVNYLTAVRIETNGKHTDAVYISQKFFDYRDYLKRKNPPLKNFRLRYVSSEPTEW